MVTFNQLDNAGKQIEIATKTKDMLMALVATKAERWEFAARILSWYQNQLEQPTATELDRVGQLMVTEFYADCVCSGIKRLEEVTGPDGVVRQTVVRV